MTRLSVIDVDRIEIASPCTADWGEMLGDDRVRFCGSCEKHVYDLGALTRPEIHALIEETEGVFCGRVYRRGDGTVLTADCPVGLAEKARLLAKRAARRMLAMAALLAVSLLSGAFGFFSARGQKACDVFRPRIEAWTGTHTLGEMAPTEVLMGDVAVPEDGDVLMGKVAVP